MSVVLAFDTATAATAVGVVAGDRVLARRDDPPAGTRPNHAARLLELCEELLDDAGAGWGDVTRIGVGVGPGTFTGLRIGVATARALAQASGAVLVPISTLEALARGASERDPAGPACLAALDARRGELFAAAWSPAMDRVVEPRAIAPDRVGELTAGAGGPWLGIGDGALRYREPLEAAGIAVPADEDAVHRVDGAVLATLALAGEPVRAGALVPDYLRLPDAEIARRERVARA